MLVERLLERMKLTVFRHSLDGYDLPTLSLDGKHGTRLDRVSIQMHSASTAIAGVAPHVRARELGHCSDEVHQQSARFYLPRVVSAVDAQRYSPFMHSVPPQFHPLRGARLPPAPYGRAPSSPVGDILPNPEYPR